MSMVVHDNMSVGVVISESDHSGIVQLSQHRLYTYSLLLACSSVISVQPVPHYPHTNHIDRNPEQPRAQSWDSNHMFTNASGIEIYGGTFSISQTNRTSKGVPRSTPVFDDFQLCSLTANM